MAVDSSITVEWDADNDGNTDQTEEDITAYVEDLQVTVGRDFPSQISGRSVPGTLRATLNNDDGRFGFFNTSSPLNTSPFSLKSGRKIRVRTSSSSPSDPVLLARDRFNGSGALGNDELGTTWAASYGGTFSRSGSGFITASGAGAYSGWSIATLPVGQANGVAHLRLHDRIDVPNHVGIVYRWQNTNNWGRVSFHNLAVTHYTTSGGSTTTRSSVGLNTERAFITLQVYVTGSNLYCFVDGVLMFHDTTVASASGTSWGIINIDAAQATPAIEEFQMWDQPQQNVTGMLWTGDVTTITPQVARGPIRTATLEATGWLSRVANATIRPPDTVEQTSATGGAYPGEIIGAVLAQCMAMHPIRADGLSPGAFRLGNVGLANMNALEAARAVEATELGWIHETPEGPIAFDAQDHRSGSSSQATFSDATAATLPYESIEVLDWHREIINRSTAEVPPRLPTLVAGGASSGATALGVNSTISLSLPTSGVASGQLMLCFIASSVGFGGDDWFVAPGWKLIQQRARNIGMAVFAKVLNSYDISGVTNTFYNDESDHGGAWRVDWFVADNWYGDIDQGVSLGYIESNSAPLFVSPWGRVPTTLIACTTGISTASGGSFSSLSDDNLPSGYRNGGGGKQDGDTDPYDVGVMTAGRAGIIDVEYPAPWFNGAGISDFLFNESVIVGIRGYAGSPPAQSGGQVFTADDADSQVDHNVVATNPNPGRLFPGQTEADAYNTAVLATYADDRPILRIGFTANRSSSHRTQAWTRRLGDRVTIVADNNTGLGIDADFYIETISHHFSQGTKLWQVVWDLSPA